VALKIFELNQDASNFRFSGSAKVCACEDYPFGFRRIAKLAAQLQTLSVDDQCFRSLFTPSERATRRFKWVQTFRKTDFLPRKEALLALLVILEKEDLRNIFYAQQRPILFINGSEDYICQKSFYESLQGKIPTAHFVWFNKCGHFPFISRPHEFNGAVAGFLESQRI
jgi:pimeloyl-[acyl-carrier protein] methyl ester esterase